MLRVEASWHGCYVVVDEVSSDRQLSAMGVPQATPRTPSDSGRPQSNALWSSIGAVGKGRRMYGT